METSAPKGKGKATEDSFFMERLEMLYEQGLGDVRAFAERENRPFEEVKRHLSELHCKSLFTPGLHSAATNQQELVSRVLRAVSQQLESLETLAGLQSFFLVVSPDDQDDEGFLGGTVVGREFWRGHRGCGIPGAQAFKARCIRQSRSTTPASNVAPPPPSVSSERRKGPARELKTELYAAVRDALRLASGIRNAEMKWTNHSKLSVYGVRLVGWPDDVPLQNPSTLSVTQNQVVLDLLHDGKLFFSRADGSQTSATDTAVGNATLQPDEDAMFEDSIDYSWIAEGETENGPHPSAKPGDLSRSPAILLADFDEMRKTTSRENTASAESTLRGATPKRRRIGDT